MKDSFVFLADGFEEIEALATVDILRRAGIPVKTISINHTKAVTGAHGIKVEADSTIADADISDSNWLICPGGLPGASNLAACRPLCEALVAHAKGGRVAAICAAPALVLAPLGILKGKKATCYPGFEEACREEGAEMHDTDVVADGNIVTGNGPASTVRFALTIVQQTLGNEAAEQVGSGMLYYPRKMNFYF